MTGLKLIILKNKTNPNPIILYCSMDNLLDSVFLEDLIFENGEIRIDGPGIWVWEGEIRIEQAGWFGPSWSEGGLYMVDYKSTARRASSFELSDLRFDKFSRAAEILFR